VVAPQLKSPAKTVCARVTVKVDESGVQVSQLSLYALQTFRGKPRLPGLPIMQPVEPVLGQIAKPFHGRRPTSGLSVSDRFPLRFIIFRNFSCQCYSSILLTKHYQRERNFFHQCLLSSNLSFTYPSLLSIVKEREIREK